MADIRPIDIQDLELDLANYRINPQPDQRSAIRELILVQGDKMVTLAKDIIDRGLSPFDLVMVTESSDNPSVFTVLEGNRRVAALKCVHEPALAAETSESKAFAELNKVADLAPYEILCSVVEGKEEAFEFIRRKHESGLGGAGTETWTAVMKERALADRGRGTPTHAALQFVMKNAELDPVVKEKVEHHKFPITTLRRILESTSKVKTALGLDMDDKARSFKSSADKTWVLEVLTDMVTAVATGTWRGSEFNVRNIIDKTQREQFLNDVLKDHPKPSGKSTEWTVNAATELDPSPKSSSPPKTRLHPHTLDRKTLIPFDFKLPLPAGKANDIFLELKRVLEVKRCPNAVGVLFRVFIEFSAQSYIKRHQVAVKTKQKGDATLAEKLKAIVKDMNTNGALDQKATTKINQMLSDRNSLVSAYTLNQYVHNPDLIPAPMELKTSWGSIQLFIDKCWTA